MKVINKILVPIDFSENSTDVVQKAVDFANHTGAALILLHVYNRPLFRYHTKAGYGIDKVHLMDKTLLRWAERRIDARYHQMLKELSGVQKDQVTFIKTRGLLTHEIKEVIKSHNIDLVVIGARQKDRKHNLWSYKATRLTHKVKIPILILPYRFELHKPVKIAFAYDLKEIHNLRELDIIKEFASLYRAHIHLFTITNETFLSEKEEGNMDLLKEFFGDFSPEIHVINDEGVEEGIHHYLSINDISLLSVLHRSRGIIEKIFHKSISKRIAINSEVPVLSIDDH